MLIINLVDKSNSKALILVAEELGEFNKIVEFIHNIDTQLAENLHTLDFEVLKSIIIFGASESLEEKSSGYLGDNIIKLFPIFINDIKVQKLFPRLFDKIKQLSLEVLYSKDNYNLARFFIENLEFFIKDFGDLDWVKKCLKPVVAADVEFANKFVIFYLENEVVQEDQDFQDLRMQCDSFISEVNKLDIASSIFDKIDLAEVYPYKSKESISSWKLVKIMKGKGENFIKELSLSEQEVKVLRDINDRIREEYKKLLDSLKGSIPEQDFNNIFLGKGDVKMSSLHNNLEFFIARYLVKKIISGKKEGKSILFTLKQEYKDLPELFQQIFETIITAYEVHIPLYDKAFEEFDGLKKLGDVVEIYLGRDGIYAYIGRRAQRAVREKFHKKLSSTNLISKLKRKESIEKKENLDDVFFISKHRIDARYLVFPTLFLQLFAKQDYEKIKEYLEFHNILPSSKQEFEQKRFIFFDTGYAGSVPAWLIRFFSRHFGFELITLDDIDKDIFLLYADSKFRQISGLGDDIDFVKVEEIEIGPLYVQDIEGLYKDPSSGKFVIPFGKPVDPIIYLEFSIIKQILVRHYFIKEVKRLNNNIKKNYDQ